MLTDDEIYQAVNTAPLTQGSASFVLAVGRAIEAKVLEKQRELAGVPVSPSGGVWVEWEHVCSQKGEPVLTTKDRRCRFCGLAEADGVTRCDDAENAARYRWLRQQHWSKAPLCVVARPALAVKLGHDCPALDRLDAAIDEAMAVCGLTPEAAK